MKDSTTSPERRAQLERSGHWGEETLASRLVSNAERAPDSLAIVDGNDGREISYAQLLEDVFTLAAYLRERGIAPGDTVSVQLPNRYEAAVADLAVLMAGAVLNPLLPNYRYRELRHILDVAGSKAIVTPVDYRSHDFIEMTRRLMSDLPQLEIHLATGDAPDVVSLASVLNEGPSGSFDGHTRAAGEVSEIIFTSGTEAAPKAVMHTEQTTNFGVTNTHSWLEMDETECVWMPSPVGHSTGLNYGLRFAVYFGLPLVLQDIWDPHRAIELVDAYDATYTLAATTFLSDLVRASSPGTERLRTLRLFSCGGAPVPPELVEAADARGMGVRRLYGSTELLCVSWMPPQAPREKVLSTDGAIMPHVDVEVWDADGEPVELGVPGELVARSPCTAVGFHDDPERTAATFLDDGWVRSGDVVEVERDGYLTVVGRKKEIIIRGGMNIAPREIEDVLAGMPGVAAVAVIGVPDDRLGEIACACVVPEPTRSDPIGLEDVVSFLRAQEVATYKLPQRLEILRELPMTASGKVQKHVIRRQLGESASR